MALGSDAAMVLFYDVTGDTRDHDDWHSTEHFHERLSIPGFRRATRWVASQGTPRYLVIYEVSDTGIATSPAYLARLNDPSPWTAAMMPRFRGMVRGFCDRLASAGFGLGQAALALRFDPADGRETALSDRLVQEVMPALAASRGLAGCHLLSPAAPPPMTREQAIRGRDAPMPWLLLATAYDAEALDRAAALHLGQNMLEAIGVMPGAIAGRYRLHCMADAEEVARTPPHPPGPRYRRPDGPKPSEDGLSPASRASSAPAGGC